MSRKTLLAPLPVAPKPTLQELRTQVRAAAENRPGIYRMLGPAGEVLYIGKSIRVRTRLLSYFRADRGEKAAEIVGHAHRIDWEHTPSEFAALLRELELIKRWRPPYNVEHKRDESYCFIKLTREFAPRLVVANEAAEDRALYYGPFRGRERVREALRELSDLLELRDCAATVPMRFSDQVELFARDNTPLCLRADLHRCLAPCAARCTRQAYMERVELARRFLEGDAERPLAILNERMLTASERLQFEYAAELRDRAARLLQVRDQLVSLRGTLENLSFAYQVPGHAGEDRVYLLRRGIVRAEMVYPLPAALRRGLTRRVREIYHTPQAPLASIPAHDIAQILLVARWFRLNPAELERTGPPERILRIRRSA
jgi:excinuclease ABC subunit C